MLEQSVQEKDSVLGPWPLIVLAAGASRRFGSDKRFARLGDGRYLMERTLEECCRLSAQRWLVLEAEQPKAMQLAQRFGYRVVIAERASDGMGASIAAGVAALPEDAGACWICPVDLPLLSVDSLSPLLELLHESLAETALAPEYQGKRGHPAWIARRHFPLLRELSADLGAKALWRQGGVGRCVPVKHAGVILDADTPKQLTDIESEAKG